MFDVAAGDAWDRGDRVRGAARHAGRPPGSRRTGRRGSASRSVMRTSARVNAVTWDGRSFVAVGEDRSELPDWNDLATATARAAVWTSADGRTWTRVPHTHGARGRRVHRHDGGPDHGRHAGRDGRPGRARGGRLRLPERLRGLRPAAWTSPDGVSWQRAVAMPTVPGVLKAVASSGAGYVAVGAESCAGSATIQAGDCPALVLTHPTAGRGPSSRSRSRVTCARSRGSATATSPLRPTDPSSCGPAAMAPPGYPPRLKEAPRSPTSGSSLNGSLAATPETAVWLGPAGTETAPAAWVSGAGPAP